MITKEIIDWVVVREKCDVKEVGGSCVENTEYGRSPENKKITINWWQCDEEGTLKCIQAN